MQGLESVSIDVIVLLLFSSLHGKLLASKFYVEKLAVFLSGTLFTL